MNKSKNIDIPKALHLIEELTNGQKDILDILERNNRKRTYIYYILFFFIALVISLGLEFPLAKNFTVTVVLFMLSLVSFLFLSTNIYTKYKTDDIINSSAQLARIIRILSQWKEHLGIFDDILLDLETSSKLARAEKELARAQKYIGSIDNFESKNISEKKSFNNFLSKNQAIELSNLYSYVFYYEATTLIYALLTDFEDNPSNMDTESSSFSVRYEYLIDAFFSRVSEYGNFRLIDDLYYSDFLRNLFMQHKYYQIVDAYSLKIKSMTLKKDISIDKMYFLANLYTKEMQKDISQNLIEGVVLLYDNRI